MKKIAIISINDRIALHGKTARSIDTIWLKKFIEHREPETKVEYVSQKLLETIEDKDVIDYMETNLQKYDELYIINSMIQFIGGDIKKHTIKMIKDIVEYKKPINVLFTDPSLYFINFPQKIVFGSNLKYKDELRLDENDIEKWKQLNLKALWTGCDYEKYTSGIHRKYYQYIEEHENIQFFEFIFMNKDVGLKNAETKDDIINSYDICYWGDKRGGYRQKKIKQFLNTPHLRKLFIGQDPGLENSTCFKKLSHKETMEKIKLSQAALVIGDKEHNGNITTYRFFESIKSGLITFIDKEYDPDMRLIKDDLLRNLLYVEGFDDILKSLYFIAKNNGRQAVIDAQLKELEKWDYLKIK